jgi:biotin transporter BioY
MRNAVIAVLSVVIGVLASTIAGEAWFFIPFDVFQAAFASVVAVLVVNRYVKADSR